MGHRKITPPINSKGIFELHHPFTVSNKTVYEVVAIREIPDLQAEQIDIYKTYYQPKGISYSEYEKDINNDVAIISLYSSSGVIYVPDTYIVRYPELAMGNYRHVVLSVSLGAVNKEINLAGLKKEIAEVCSKFLGVTANVRTHVAPTRDALTQAEADTLEKVRRGKIDIPDTSELKRREAQTKLNAIIHNNNAKLAKKAGGTWTIGQRKFTP